MTGHAQVRTLGQKQFVQLCLVGAVALRTFIGENRFMLTFPLFYLFAQVLMAGKAEGTLFFDYDTFDIGPMGIVACQTLPFCKRIMIRPSRNFLHEVAVTLSTYFRCRRLEKILFTCPMRNVACITVGIYNGFMRISL